MSEPLLGRTTVEQRPTTLATALKTVLAKLTHCTEYLKEWTIGAGRDFATSCGALLVIEMVDCTQAFFMLCYHNKYNDSMVSRGIFTIAYTFQFGFSTLLVVQTVLARSDWTEAVDVLDLAHDGYDRVGIKILKHVTGLTPLFEAQFGVQSRVIWFPYFTSAVKNMKQLSQHKTMARLKVAETRVELISTMPDVLRKLNMHLPRMLLAQSDSLKKVAAFEVWSQTVRQVAALKKVSARVVEGEDDVFIDIPDQVDVPETDDTGIMSTQSPPSLAAHCDFYVFDFKDVESGSTYYTTTAPNTPKTPSTVSDSASPVHSSPTSSGLTAKERHEGLAVARLREQMSSFTPAWREFVLDRSGTENTDELDDGFDGFASSVSGGEVTDDVDSDTDELVTVFSCDWTASFTTPKRNITVQIASNASNSL